jgi:hypothetical protein
MREVEREADLESVKKEFQAINDQTKIDASFDPVGIMRDDMTKAVQSPVEIAKSENLKPEIGAPEIGKSETAPTASEPAEAAPVAASIEMEARPVAAPAVRQSAAE